jgi:hypothetical protein
MPLPVIDPVTLAAVAQGVIGGAKSIFGASQAAKARRRLKQIEKERPKGYIPSAILERANEPVAEEYMEAQEMGAQRRTSQGIGALSQGGSRAILGGLPSLTENERVGDVQRAGMYEQERRRALVDKGNAQERIRQEARQDWQNKMNAQTAQIGAGTQNIFTGLEDIGEASLFFAKNKLGDELTSKTTSTDAELPADDLLGSSVMDDPKLDGQGIDMDIKETNQLPTMDDPALEEEGVDMDSNKNPFELPNGGLRVPLPNGGTIDVPPQEMGNIFDNGDGTMTIPTPNGKVTVPSFKIGGTGKGGVLPTPIGTFKF